MSEEQPRKRRERYRGTHPRHFEQKYKELERRPEELAKVEARGQTPAGTHRPICVREILEALNPGPGQTGVDATLGHGGHTGALLPRLMPGGLLYALDVDPIELPRTEARLREQGFGPEVLQVRRMNFAGISGLLPQAGPFDFVLADLGVSSMQLDDPARGFSYKAEGPLDLRLNPDQGQPASDLLRHVSQEELTHLLIENSDEPRARPLAGSLHGQHFETTTQLAKAIRQVVEPLVPQPERQETLRQTLQRVFQALRIAVNQEMEVLEQFLEDLPGCLKPGGRVAILTFHSGEDRRVKKAFQAQFRSGIYTRFTREPIRPGFEEQRDNPRSAGAKLRWAEKA